MGTDAPARNSHVVGHRNSVVPGEAFGSLDAKLLDLLPGAVYFCDQEGAVVRWNRRAVELWGREPRLGDPAERFCGSYKLYRLDGTFMAHADCPVADALRTGEAKHNIEAVIERPDGSRRFILANIDAIRDAGGAVVGAVNILQDITDRKQAETALRQSEQRFRCLLDNLPAGGYTCDAQGLITYFNRRAVELWGREPKLNDPVDRYCGSFKLFTTTGTPIVHDECWMALALRGERDYIGREIVVERPDGSRRTALAYASPFHDESGRVAGAVNVLVDITEQKRTEGALRESEDHLRAVVETTPACIKVVAPDGTLLDMNSAGLGMVDADQPEDVKGKCVYGLICDEYRDAFRHFNERVCRGEPGSLEFEIVGLRGTRRRVETHAVPLRWPGDGFVQLAITQDITERQRAEAALRESEGRFRGLMEQAPFSVQVFSPDGRTVRANRAWEELWGVTLDQIAGYNILEDKQLEAKGVLPLIKQAFDGLPSRIPAIRYDPNETIPDVNPNPDPERWVAAVAYPLKDESGGVREVVLVHEDITARRRAEAALQESEEKFRLLADTIPQLAWMARPDGHIFWFNRRWYEYTGTTPEEMEGWGWQSVHNPAVLPKVLERWKGSIASGEPFDMVFPIRGADGAFRPFLTRVNPLRDQQGRTLYWFGTNTDISEIKRMEEALRAADRRKDEFLATLAHELRNPLAPIRNSLQILKMPRVDTATAQQSREMMERQVQHLVRLVDDLMDVSRVMRGKIELRRERVELATVVARAVETVQPLIVVQGHELEISLPSDSLLLDADPVRLAQVVANLLTNAAKYTDARGHIWLTAEREDGVAVLRVRDNGIGIAPHMLPQVFDLFVQVDNSSTKAQGGLGIGLTLSKNLVEMHGGTVHAYSAGLGKGSEFVIRLPLLAAEQQEPIQRDNGSESLEKQPPGHRLLVVDDNKDAAVSLAMLLQLQGHEVRVVHDGVAALDALSAFHPDLVFLDIGMPGMDGYEVTRRLRQMPGMEKVLVAALTGWGQQEVRRRTAEAGFDHHLVKPPDPKALHDLLTGLKDCKAQ